MQQDTSLLVASKRRNPAISWQVIQRYAGPLPRYTSYPTAPNWQHLDHIDACEALTAAAGPSPMSVYIHIPFCQRMCFYCGCNTVVTRSDGRVKRYIQSLYKELAMAHRLTGDKPLTQLHLGGGTPTFLTPWELRGLLERIFECYPVQEGAELSIEIDPAVTTAEHLSELRALGFNRLSIGVQDFSEEVQDAVGRHQGASVTYETYTEARELGFGSINVDLMYGLPKQTIAHVTRSVDRVIDMGVDRVAVFGYAHVPWLKPHQRRLEIYGLPDSQTRWLMSEAAREKLLDAGYVAIGMDHFAKPNDEIVAAYEHGRLNRNFQGYTVMNTTDLLGLGASAISDISGTYLQNRVRLGDYMSAVENGRFATVKGVRRSADDNLRSWLIKSIMCHLRIDYDDAHARFGVNVPKDFADALAQLAPLEDDGVVKRLDDALVVTEPGRLLVRNVASAFDAYLDSRSPAESQFSKAI